ncbi:response regulator transcription factor [Halocola ammonii]
MMTATRKALIIDDEQDICLLLAAVLKKNGFITDFSNTLEEASDKIVPFDPQLIILDLNLPDGNGFSLIPEIKEKLPNVKIVVCSAYDGPKEKNRARREGADAFVGKPLERSVLQDTIENLSSRA